MIRNINTDENENMWIRKPKACDTEVITVLTNLEVDLRDLTGLLFIDLQNFEGNVASFLAIYPMGNGSIYEMALQRLEEIRNELRTFGYGARFKGCDEPYWISEMEEDELVVNVIAYPIGTAIKTIEKYDKEYNY